MTDGLDSTPPKPRRNHGRGLVQGEGFHETPLKLTAIRYALATLASIVRNMGAKWGRLPYWVIDTNSGSGFNQLTGMYGTPVIARDELRHLLACRDVTYFFCDKTKKALSELEKTLGPAGPGEAFNFLTGDNEQALTKIQWHIRKHERNPAKAMGVIICDPNGTWYKSARGHGPPLNLPEILQSFPRMDLILHLDFSAQYRPMATYLPRLKKKDGTPQKDCCPDKTIDEVLQLMNKAHWLVRLTGGNGKSHHFLTFYGTNFAGRFEQRAHGFHRLQSKEGQKIMDDVRQTENNSLQSRQRLIEKHQTERDL